MGIYSASKVETGLFVEQERIPGENNSTSCGLECVCVCSYGARVVNLISE